MVVETSKACNKKEEQQEFEPSSGVSVSLAEPPQIFPNKQSGDDDDDDDKQAVSVVVSPEKGGPRESSSFSGTTGNMSRLSKVGVKAEKTQCIAATIASNDDGDDGVDSKGESSPSATAENAGKRKAKSECSNRSSSGDEAAEPRASKSLRTTQTPDEKASRASSKKATRLRPSQEKYLQVLRKNVENKKKGKSLLEKAGTGRTAPYCILKALYDTSEESLSKPALIKDAEALLGTPMESNPSLLHSQGYGAWSSIGTLEKHELVKRQKCAGSSKDDYFSLTAEGCLFCTNLFTAMNNKKPAPVRKLGSSSAKSSPGQDIRTFFFSKAKK